MEYSAETIMLKLTAALAVIAWCAAPLGAGTVTTIKLDLGGNTDFQYVGGVFSTMDDGDGATAGNQNSTILFTGPFAYLGSLAGSFSMSGIAAFGLPTVVAGVGVQATHGGSFSLYDLGNNLILSGTADAAAITGAVGFPSGSVFTTSSLTFTGGSLFALIAAHPGDFSIALSSTRSGATDGFLIDGGALAAFTANGVGEISTSPLPEPAAPD